MFCVHSLFSSTWVRSNWLPSSLTSFLYTITQLTFLERLGLYLSAARKEALFSCQIKNKPINQKIFKKSFQIRQLADSTLFPKDRVQKELRREHFGWKVKFSLSPGQFPVLPTSCQHYQDGLPQPPCLLSLSSFYTDCHQLVKDGKNISWNTVLM